MWLTSKRPARVRTAMCSSVTLLYSSGMSQPANGTILAPDARCRTLRGVFLSAAAVGCSMNGGSALIERYYAVLGRSRKRVFHSLRPRCHDKPRSAIDGIHTERVLLLNFLKEEPIRIVDADHVTRRVPIPGGDNGGPAIRHGANVQRKKQMALLRWQPPQKSASRR